MSDITRDDMGIIVAVDTAAGVEYEAVGPITNEEFDRLAREAGYIPLAEGAVLEYYRTYANDSERARMLRALLTDECDLPMGNDEFCPKCGGRGWLPKGEVVDRLASALDGGVQPGPFQYRQHEAMTLLLEAFGDWLKAEDEQ